MNHRVIIFLLTVLITYNCDAQLNPTQIRYTAWDIHALRFYPFKERADSIVAESMRTSSQAQRETFSRTSVDFVIDKDYYRDLSSYSQITNNWMNKLIFKPYGSWMNYAHPFHGNNLILNLARFDNDDNTLFDIFGINNIEYFVTENLGEPDLRKAKNEAFLYKIKTPLHPEHFSDYNFFLSSLTEADSIPCYEIVFFSKKKKDHTYEGYLYISRLDNSLVKAVYTLNSSLNKRRIEELLFTQTPDRIETQAFMGDDMQGCLLLSQIRTEADNQADLEIPGLTPAQKDLERLQEEANRTRAYRNVGKGAYFLMTRQFHTKYFDFGPLFQTGSYNTTEGLRLRLGGNTSEKFSKKVQLGGYLAYGFKDEAWKYRGDISYAITPNDRLSVSYVNDLNIPGYDLLTSPRDDVFRSFTHSGVNNMSEQQIGFLNYEKEFPEILSFRVGGKYLSDRPKGKVQYIRDSGDIAEIIPELRTSEVHFGVRYAPNEKYVRIGNQKINFHEPDLVIDINHRIGIKDLFNSDYAYHITNFSASKRFSLPADAGNLALGVSGGKVWNKVPFPLLFIPAGNQSYIYNPQDYNLMNFYELITDQYIAGNLNLEFNWSPFDLFMKSPVKMGLGIRTLYGPLSEKNDPAVHSDLFLFNNGVKALTEKPYTEVNIGLINLLKVFRVDYVYRLNYGRKGSVFFTTSYLF